MSGICALRAILAEMLVVRSIPLAVRRFQFAPGKPQAPKVPCLVHSPNCCSRCRQHPKTAANSRLESFYASLGRTGRLFGLDFSLSSLAMYKMIIARWTWLLCIDITVDRSSFSLERTLFPSMVPLELYLSHSNAHCFQA